MRFFKRNNFLLFFFFIITTVVAQTLPSRNITVNDGLPCNGIKCFYKDSRGLMWIGTEAGLCCYDGSTYKIYNETNGLKYNEVWAIAEDKDHNLWFSLYGKGLAKFDGKKFSFYDKKNGLVNNAIRKMYYSKKHNCLVLGTENGLSLFDGKHFKSFIKKTLFGKFQVNGISEKANQTLISVPYSGVFTLEIQKNIQQSTLKKVFTPSFVLYSSFIDGNTYFGGSSLADLYLKNLKTNSETKIPCPIIWDFVKDDENNIYGSAWNVTDPKGGLFQYSNNQITDITQKTNIKSTGLWCLYYEKETKQLWVGSIDKGIYIVDLSGQIKYLQPSFFNLNQIEIQCLYNDRHNNVWIGAKNNIIIKKADLTYTKLERATIWKLIYSYLKKNGVNPENNAEYGQYFKKNEFSCLNIVADNEGYVWVTTTFGIFCFDKSYSIRYFKFSQEGHIAFDENDQLLFGLMYGEMYLSTNKFDIKNAIIKSLKDQNIPRDITKIVNQGNQIWFATYTNGLINYQNNTFYSLNLHKQFSETYIKDIIINNNNELVIGTNSGMVYICKWTNNRLKILHTYKPNKILFGTSISFIEQSKGYYFIGTNKGINVIKDNKFIKLINQSEGVNDIQFNDCTKDKNGDLWVATNEGLLFLDVQKIIKQKNDSNFIQITNIKVNRDTYKGKDLNELWNTYAGKELRLAHNQNDIEISFNNYNLLNADKNIYRYKIIGLSDTWSDFESSTKIELRGVPNGKYQLLIEGKNIGTGVLFKTKILSILITPPFWKTWWFISSVVLVLIVIGFVGYKKRIQYISEQEKAKGAIQKRLAETKMEALQSQMNPHFIFNAMNSIQNFIIDNNTDDALMYMGEFSKLIRQTLNNSSKQRISLADEIQYLETYIQLENMRFKDAISFKFSVSKTIDAYEVTIPPMLLQPFVENVFVHAFDSNSINPTLEISFTQSDNLLVCEIKDNGKGMVENNLNKLYASKGIKLVKERIGLLQNDNSDPIVINSSITTGTIIKIKIQLDF